MNKYSIYHRQLKKEVTIESDNSKDACQELGWDKEDCLIVQIVPNKLWISDEDQQMIDDKDYQEE